MGCRNQQEATAPIKSQVKLLPWLLSLQWKTCLRQNCSLGFFACSEGPAFGQNTDDDDDDLDYERGKVSSIVLQLNLLIGKSVEQAVPCMSVTQRAWVRSPVGTSFLGEVFFLNCKLYAHQVHEYNLAIIIILLISALLE